MLVFLSRLLQEYHLFQNIDQYFSTNIASNVYMECKMSPNFAALFGFLASLAHYFGFTSLLM